MEGRKKARKERKTQGSKQARSGKCPSRVWEGLGFGSAVDSAEAGGVVVARATRGANGPGTFDGSAGGAGIASVQVAGGGAAPGASSWLVLSKQQIRRTERDVFVVSERPQVAVRGPGGSDWMSAQGGGHHMPPLFDPSDVSWILQGSGQSFCHFLHSARLQHLLFPIPSCASACVFVRVRTMTPTGARCKLSSWLTSCFFCALLAWLLLPYP